MIESSLFWDQLRGLKKGAREMKRADKVIKTKVGLLELGKQLGNVSKACKGMG